MAGVSSIFHRVRGVLPHCEHSWSYPYGIRFDATGRPHTMEWRCNRCGKRQWGAGQ